MTFFNCFFKNIIRNHCIKAAKKVHTISPYLRCSSMLHVHFFTFNCSHNKENCLSKCLMLFGVGSRPSARSVEI